MVGGDCEATAHLGSDLNHVAVVIPLGHGEGALELGDDLTVRPTEDLEVVERQVGQLVESRQPGAIVVPHDAGLGAVETTATPPGPGAKEVLADALVGTHADDDVVDVGANAFADRGDGVDEAQLGGQERVGRVLDGFGRCRVGDDHRGADAVVERRHLQCRGLVVAADHDAIRLQEVLHCGPLAEELGVGHDLHVGPTHHPLDDLGAAHRHGRLVDDDRFVRQHGADLSRRGLDVAEIGGAVVALRCGHAQEGDLAIGCGVGRPEHERQPTAGDAFFDQLLQTELDDRDHAAAQALDLGGIDVGAHDLVTHVGEAGPRGQAHVTGADDSDLGHGVERLAVRSRDHRGL